LEFTVQGQKFRVQGKFLGPPRKMAREELVGQALKFLGIPYAWGGRNPFGLDCSGFVQLVYKIGGAFLPRDAGPQAETGKKVERFGDRKPGDLAFFAAGRGISHVGICMPGDKILHASGMVRADKLDETGIFNEESGGYTHQLVCIRNVLK
jgi:cell wall-associated NlpC family hydrolase